MELYFLIFPPDTLLIDYFILPYCKRNIEVMTMRNYVNVSDNQKYWTFCHVKTAQSTLHCTRSDCNLYEAPVPATRAEISEVLTNKIK